MEDVQLKVSGKYILDNASPMYGMIRAEKSLRITTFEITLKADELFSISERIVSSYELEIIVPECEYGHWFYSSSENSRGSYYLIKDGKVIQEEINSSLRDYAFVFCVPLDTYELHVYFPASQARVSIVRDDQSVYFDDQYVREVGQFHHTLDYLMDYLNLNDSLVQRYVY